MTDKTFAELSAVPLTRDGGSAHGHGCSMDGVFKLQIAYQCGVPTHQEMYHHRPPPVPEPATSLLLALGVVAVYLFKRFRT